MISVRLNFLPRKLSSFRFFFCWLACGSLLAACGGSGSNPLPPPGTPNDFSKTISVAGVSRNYLLHVPATYVSTNPSAVVLLFHGGNGSAATVGGITSGSPGGFSALADKNNFIAIYPNAIDGNWDDGRETITYRTNDVAFTEAILDAVAREYNLDAKRIFAAGISNGGMMSHRLACDLSNRIAAVATVAANIPSAITANCAPLGIVPVAMFSGTADPIMPYAGGAVSGNTGGSVLSAPDTALFWANKNQVPLASQNSVIPDADPNDGTTADLFSYAGAGPGEVAFYRVNNGGHTWPGGTQYIAAFGDRQGIKRFQCQRCDVGIFFPAS
jgi:polyhydroxybutyrate depolymerase